MGWQAVVLLNAVIAACYVGISCLIAQGLVRTRQTFSNPLALATSAIFMTCAIHHGHHALHLATAFSGADAVQVASVRALFGEWHSVAIDALGAVVAITYLRLRHSYKALLNTPSMFEDAVRDTAERTLREIAFTDQLTGVPNRAAYQAHADALAQLSDDVVVLFVDLDAFKQVNDLHGHDAGDRLLRDVAQRLAAGLEPGERLFRIGGDEFVVVALLPAAQARDLAERVEQLIATPVDARDGALVVGASVGVASGPARSGVDHLLREADAHMYRIKGSARPEVIQLPSPSPPADLVLHLPDRRRP